MSQAVVTSQLSTFANKTKDLQKFNPFIPASPISVGVPISTFKTQVTTSDAQTFNSNLNFLLSKVDFISEIYAVVTLTMDSNVKPAPGYAMSAIRQVSIESSQGQIAFYDYRTVMSHLGTRNGNEWWSSALKFAGGYDPASAIESIGCAWIPTPWSTLTSEIANFSPLPTFLYNGSLKLQLATAPAVDLQTNDTASAINVSLIVNGFNTISSLRQDLLNLPSYGWYNRDYQTIPGQAVTTTSSAIDISRFTGQMANISVKTQLDSTRASGTADWWLLSSLTDISLQLGSDVVYQTYSSSVNEPKMDTFITGGYNGYSYCSQVEGATDLGEVWTRNLASPTESMAVFAGGAILSEITASILSLTSVSASSTADILAEMISFFNIENQSIRRYQ